MLPSAELAFDFEPSLLRGSVGVGTPTTVPVILRQTILSSKVAYPSWRLPQFFPSKNNVLGKLKSAPSEAQSEH